MGDGLEWATVPEQYLLGPPCKEGSEPAKWKVLQTVDTWRYSPLSSSVRKSSTKMTIVLSACKPGLKPLQRGLENQCHSRISRVEQQECAQELLPRNGRVATEMRLRGSIGSSEGLLSYHGPQNLM